MSGFFLFFVFSFKSPDDVNNSYSTNLVFNVWTLCLRTAKLLLCNIQWGFLYYVYYFCSLINNIFLRYVPKSRHANKITVLHFYFDDYKRSVHFCGFNYSSFFYESLCVYKSTTHVYIYGIGFFFKF